MAPGPQRLRPDNFTPPTRTPWGGRNIASVYKKDLVGDRHNEVIGESWEISVEPSFPSLMENGVELREVLESDPVAWLGADVAARFEGQLPLLIKLLDASDNLSVQVHPKSCDPALCPDESGKPESWIILHAEEGSGIFLGFREGVERGDVERCLAEQGELDRLLNFVPVRAGDVFVIDAGTAHAIGAGVTLIEPQFVVPGRRGVTYRFWDWNRLYNREGKRDPSGKPRELHVQRSLEVTDWKRGGGEAFVESCRATPTLLQEKPGLRHFKLLETPHFEAERMEGSGRVSVTTQDTLLALTVVRGSVEVETDLGRLSLPCGYSGVIPAATFDVEMTLEDADLFLTRVGRG